MDVELKEGEKIFYVKIKKEINSNNSPEVENQLMIENIENKEYLMLKNQKWKIKH